MFWFEHPDYYLARLSAERERIERRNRLLRALRGATPPFSGDVEERLRVALREAAEGAGGGR